MSSKPGVDLGPIISALDSVATWSGQKLGDGGWAATLELKDGRSLELEQLATSWKVTDVSAGSVGRPISSSSLEAVLKKADVR